MKNLYLYTATAGLGDYVVMGGVIQTVERHCPGSRCLVVHRGNPHVRLWPDGDWRQRFFDVHSPVQVGKMFATLRRSRREGFTVFGLQMAPGSLQGFFLHFLLKKIGMVDYVVDANLINADIILPPRGDYIYDSHLWQVERLEGRRLPDEAYRMPLPIQTSASQADSRRRPIRIGIHPWSRRGHHPSFVWPEERWLDLVGFFLSETEVEVVLFGRDLGFSGLREKILHRFKPRQEAISFLPSLTVPDLVAAIRGLDMVVSVNTAVVHIGHALGKEMVILSGPSLDLWIPKGRGIRIFHDEKAMYPGNDRWMKDSAFPSVGRIDSRGLFAFLYQWLAAKKKGD